MNLWTHYILLAFTTVIIAEPLNKTHWIIQVGRRYHEFCHEAVLVDWFERNASDILLTYAECFVEQHFDYVSAKEKNEVFYASHPSRYWAFFTEYDSSDRVRRSFQSNISNIAIHPEYDHRTGYKNLAIVKLSGPVILTETLQPMALSFFPNFEVENCYVMGTSLNFSVSTHTENISSIIQQPLAVYSNQSIAELDVADDDLNLLVAYPASTNENITFNQVKAPLFCQNEQSTYVQGMIKSLETEDVSAFDRVYDNVREIVYYDVSSFYVWFADAIREIDTPMAYHSELSKYEAKIRNEDFLVYGQLLKNPLFADVWFHRHYPVYDQVSAMIGSVPLSFIWHTASADNSYQCTVACYRMNQRLPCTYDPDTRLCYFASMNATIDGSQDRRITIIFNKFRINGPGSKNRPDVKVPMRQSPKRIIPTTVKTMNADVSYSDYH